MDKLLNHAPHMKHKDNISSIMLDVNIALLIAVIPSYLFFGPKILLIIAVSIGSAVLSELIFQLITKREITALDGSAFLTGLLVAYNMPPTIPLYVPIIGSIFAIIIVKQLFGGLGNNILNPALAGRLFVMFAWLPLMTTWVIPQIPEYIKQILPFMPDSLVTSATDAVSSATPLATVKLQGMQELIKCYGSKQNLYFSMLIGFRSGCLGETSTLFLLIGGIYLLIKRIITFEIPITYILTAGILGFVFGKDGLFTGDFLFQIMSGGLILGAFFMATDMVTSPLTRKGMIIFGIGCGFFTFILRKFSGYPEGVSFSILIMNSLTPLIDKYTMPKPFGFVGKKENK